MLSPHLLLWCLIFIKAVTSVVVEALAPKAYPRVTLVSASTLSESVGMTLRDREGLPKKFFLVASSLGHLRNLCSIICGSSLQRGHSGSVEGSGILVYAFSRGV